MSPSKILLACVVATAAISAHAVPTYSVSSASGSYGLPAAFTAVGTAGVATTTDSNHAAPNGIADGSPYLYSSFDTSSVTVAVNASTFSFLWGSPDYYNTVTYNTSLGDFAYTG